MIKRIFERGEFWSLGVIFGCIFTGMGLGLAQAEGDTGPAGLVVLIIGIVVIGVVCIGNAVRVRRDRKRQEQRNLNLYDGPFMHTAKQFGVLPNGLPATTLNKIVYSDAAPFAKATRHPTDVVFLMYLRRGAEHEPHHHEIGLLFDEENLLKDRPEATHIIGALMAVAEGVHLIEAAENQQVRRNAEQN